jgi:cytochrome c oxidase assembly factor CtaG
LRPDPYQWSLHPEATLGVAVLVAGYVVATRRWPAPAWRIGCFAAGAALLLATAVTPLEALQFHLLSMHLLQNVVLAEWAPALVVLGLPAGLVTTLAERRVVRVLTHPAVALPLWLAVYFTWHVPPLYDAALEHPSTLLHLEHLTYFATGCFFWWSVLRDEAGFSLGARAGYVVAAFVLASPLGLLLTLLPEPVYGFYEAAPGLWGLSALADQQIAGVTMAAEQAVVFFVVFGVLFARFLTAQERGDGYVPDEARS